MGRREEILELIVSSGGLHKSRICDELDLSWGVVGFHLSKLSRKKDILLEYHSSRMWAFPSHFDAEQRFRATHSNLPGRGDVLNQVVTRDSVTVRELSDSMLKSRKVIRRHLQGLLHAGMVQRRGGRPQRYEPRDD